MGWKLVRRDKIIVIIMIIIIITTVITKLLKRPEIKQIPLSWPRYQWADKNKCILVVTQWVNLSLLDFGNLTINLTVSHKVLWLIDSTIQTEKTSMTMISDAFCERSRWEFLQRPNIVFFFLSQKVTRYNLCFVRKNLWFWVRKFLQKAPDVKKYHHDSIRHFWKPAK